MAARRASASTEQSASGWSAIHCCRSRISSRSASWVASCALNWAWLPGPLQEQHEVAGDGQGRRARPRSSLDEGEGQVHAGGDAGGGVDVAVAGEDGVGIDGDLGVALGQLATARPVGGGPCVRRAGRPRPAGTRRCTPRSPGGPGPAIVVTRAHQRPILEQPRCTPSPPATTRVSIGPATSAQRQIRRRAGARSTTRTGPASGRPPSARCSRARRAAGPGGRGRHRRTPRAGPVTSRLWTPSNTTITTRRGGRVTASRPPSSTLRSLSAMTIYPTIPAIIVARHAGVGVGHTGLVLVQLPARLPACSPTGGRVERHPVPAPVRQADGHRLHHHRAGRGRGGVRRRGPTLRRRPGQPLVLQRRPRPVRDQRRHRPSAGRARELQHLRHLHQRAGRGDLGADRGALPDSRCAGVPHLFGVRGGRHRAQAGPAHLQPVRAGPSANCWSVAALSTTASTSAASRCRDCRSTRRAGAICSVPWPRSTTTTSTRAEQLFDERGDEIAAVIAEPVIGAGGVYPATVEYLRGLRKLCDETGALLIFDEVITGFGRLGSWFASEHYGVTPDLITFAKAVTSGYQPLGGVIVGPRVREVARGRPRLHPAPRLHLQRPPDRVRRGGGQPRRAARRRTCSIGFPTSPSASARASARWPTTGLVASVRGEGAIWAVAMHPTA